MKEQGVAETDPEFIKAQKQLQELQQQRLFQQQKAAFAQQQQQHLLNQQQNAASNSPSANGVNGARPAGPASSSPNPSLGPSTVTAAGASAAAPKTGVQRTAAGVSGYFSPDQLSILKNQIFAFKCLSKNQGIPQAVQQSLFAAQQKKLSTAIEQTLQAAAPDGEEKPAVNGVDAATGEKGLVQKRHEYTGFKSPHAGLSSKINYLAHGKREMRPMIPSIMPSGVDIEKLRNERETIVYNRMQARLSELRSLPANVVHWDTRSEDLTPEDTLKRKAIIEMKMLGLYAKQRLMRERIGRQMIQYDNLAMTANRSHYRRMKKQSLREARITEKLEKQQRDARESREKKKHTDYIQTVLNHAREVNAAAHNQRQKMQKLGRMMLTQHQNIEKEEQKRLERTAKQRLALLKSDNEEAYLKLLDQAKDTRITHLLKQTDGFLSQLAASVKQQQRKAAERYGDASQEFLGDDDSEEDEDEDEESVTRQKIDYYAVAHRIKEEVNAQPSILVGGTLKEYQLKGLQWMISL
jgi:ATP-dependent helicase STH1/SNF2